MSEIIPLTDEEMAALGRRGKTSEETLQPYVEKLQTVERGRGHRIRFADNENQRAEKRRYSLAAKSLGLKLIWKQGKDTIFTLEEIPLETEPIDATSVPKTRSPKRSA